MRASRADGRAAPALKAASFASRACRYGYCKLHNDLRDQGENCCPNRIARLANLAVIKAQIGYKRRTGKCSGNPSIVIDNTLDRQFDVGIPLSNSL